MSRILASSLLLFCGAALGQGQEQHNHSQHQHPTSASTATSAHVPPDPPTHAMGPMSVEEMAEIMAMDDAAKFGTVALDHLEWREGSDDIGWDGSARYGGDYNKFILKSEGELLDGDVAHARSEAVWDRVVARWWSLQAGVRVDSGDEPSRTWAGVGIEGLAPYWFDVEATFYVSDAGHTALRAEASYELRFTQRLILQPQIELNAYGKDDPERGIGSGLSDIDAGLRLRYEIRREFAPYLGVHWQRLFGDTADFAGEKNETQFVAGVRVWF